MTKQMKQSFQLVLLSLILFNSQEIIAGDNDQNITGFQQQAYIKASNPDGAELVCGTIACWNMGGDSFGRAIAISGNTMVVGAPFEDSQTIGVNGNQLDNSSDEAGAVYVFEKVNDDWVQQAYLKASNSNSRDIFGISVAISGGTIVVGASGEDGLPNTPEDNSRTDSGAVYVFTRSDGIWSQQAYLKAANSGHYDEFGHSVAIDGDLLVIGAPHEDSDTDIINGNTQDNTALNSGAAYVFSRSQGQWQQKAFLKASNSESNDLFGTSVSVSENLILVGSPNELNNSFINSGGVFIFKSLNNEWVQEANLMASNSEMHDKFGQSVSISEQTAVIGAPLKNSNPINEPAAIRTGAAYIYTKIGGQWVLQSYFESAIDEDYTKGEGFGVSVSISNDTIAVGATQFSRGRSSGHGLGNGSVYVYSKLNSQWNFTDHLKASNTQVRDAFGYSVAIANNNIAIGAFHKDNNEGAAFIFSHNRIELNPGFTGLWHKQDETGHGISLYMLNDNVAVATWYVYDNQGKPVWLIGVGSHDGYSITFDVSITDGGNFPPLNNSDDVNINNWGQFKLRFTDCNVGQFSWTPNENLDFTAGSMQVKRLTKTLGLNCSDFQEQNNSNDIESTQIKPSHTGLWYRANNGGNLLNVHLLNDNRMVVMWMVYDADGHPLWLMGIGTQDGSKGTLDVVRTNGALFPPDYNNEDLNIINWGQFEIEFSGCNNGLFKWIPIFGSGYAAGDMPIIRLTNTLGLICQGD